MEESLDIQGLFFRRQVRIPLAQALFGEQTRTSQAVTGHIGKARLLQSDGDGVERAVLACKIVGEDAMPGACLALYEQNPSRGLWKASMLTWVEPVHSRCSGTFDQYYLKCSLDRAFAVRAFSTATISWWPTECLAYGCTCPIVYHGCTCSVAAWL